MIDWVFRAKIFQGYSVSVECKSGGAKKWLQGSLTLFLHWFLSNMWTHSNWWFSFWISLASVLQSLPSFPDCQCLIHLHQVPSRKIQILLLFVLQFYRLQEIGMQTEIEKNLSRFSVKWEIFFYSMGEDTPLLTDRAETPGLGRSQQVGELALSCRSPLRYFEFFVFVSFRFLNNLSSWSEINVIPCPCCLSTWHPVHITDGKTKAEENYVQGCQKPH